MIKKLSVLILLIIFSSSNTFAQYIDKRFSINVNYGFSQYNIDDLVNPANSGGFNYDKINGGMITEGKFIYTINGTFSTYLGIGYSSKTTDASEGFIITGEASPEPLGVGQFSAEYNVKINTLATGFYINMVRSNPLSVKLGFGAEYYKAEVSHSLEILQVIEVANGPDVPVGEFASESKNTNCLCVVFMLRPEYKLSRQFSLCSEIGYRTVDMESEALRNELKLNANGMFITAGLNFKF